MTIHKSDLVFEKIRPDAELPTRGHETDAGFDLYCPSPLVVKAHRFARIPLGIKVQMSPREWAMLLGRSSTLTKFGLLVMPGVVDPGYTGELMIAVQNLTDRTVHVDKHQRIAQFIMMSNLNLGYEPRWGTVVQNSSRGSGGFGSTGSTKMGVQYDDHK